MRYAGQGTERGPAARTGCARWSPNPADVPPPPQSAVPIIESAPEPVVEAYKCDIDRTLLRQNLRRTVTERVENLIALQRLAAEAVRAGRSAGKDP